ncbi:MAG TPA: peptidyl-prolyl cis-trans isomerase [Atribacteraceae bacterium]|nr:peptidyl-prolyl cis-trans isomerase [Atribacteraceae bacterium]
MKNILCWLWVFVFLFLLVVGGSVVLAQNDTAKVQDNPVVAKVNGEPIYLADLQEIWDEMPENDRRQFPRGFQDLLEQWIRQHLLAQAAREQGIDQEPAILKKIENLTRQILVHEYINREIVGRVEVSDQQIESEYQANPALYTAPESRKIRHIMLNSQEDADQVLQGLREGRDFSEIAREWSIAPDAQSGGDMGFVQRGDLGPDIEETVFNLTEGSFSEVIKSDYGFHVFFVEESREARIKELSEVREEIASRLLPRMQQEAFETMIGDLKNRAEIAIIEENLPPAVVTESTE